MKLKELGLKIQSAREEKGMSQEQLAHALGCSQSALSNYEKGKRRLYLNQLEKLSEVLDKPIDYFVENLTTSTPRESNYLPSLANVKNNELLRVITELFNLNNEQITEVVNYVDYIKWRDSRKEENYGSIIEPETD